MSRLRERWPFYALFLGSGMLAGLLLAVLKNEANIDPIGWLVERSPWYVYWPTQLLGWGMIFYFAISRGWRIVKRKREGRHSRE